MSFDDNCPTTEAHERRITRCRRALDNKRCGERIIFLRSPTGKKVPIDADSVEPGDREVDPDRHVFHAGTCKCPGGFLPPPRRRKLY